MVEIPRSFDSAQDMLQAKRKSVIPLENGIQVEGMGMDPGFHRGDDKVWIPALRLRSGHAFTGMTDGAVDFRDLNFLNFLLAEIGALSANYRYVPKNIFPVAAKRSARVVRFSPGYFLHFRSWYR